MPEISIIVPVYNVEMFLSRCIESILNQTFQDFELILINDGSTDSSKSICDFYKKCFPTKIQLLSQKNAGVSVARNAGIEIANGKFITFIDSDDFVSLDFLEKMYDVIWENEVDFVFCSYNLYSGLFHDDCSIHPKIEILSVNNYFSRILDDPRLTAPWGKLFKSNLIKNLHFPEGKIMEDMFVLPFILKRTKSVAFYSMRLYNYNQVGISITRSHFRFDKLDMIDALKGWVEYSKENCPALTNRVILYYLENLFHFIEVFYNSKSPLISLKYLDYKSEIITHCRIIFLYGRFFIKVKLIFLVINCWPIFVAGNRIKFRVIENFK